MAGIYIAAFDNATITAACDVIHLGSRSARLRRVHLSSNATAYEKVRLSMKQRTSGFTQGTGGSGVTIRHISTTYATSNSAVTINSTLGSGDTPVVVYTNLWDLSKPFDWIGSMGLSRLWGADPDYSMFTVTLDTAPAASKQMSGFIEWESVDPNL